MDKHFKNANNERGFSFLEVVIALVIVSVVVAGIFRLYLAQHDGYILQENLTNLQQNARASMTALVRHIRMAGYDLPAGLAAIECYNADPDTIVIAYKSIDCDTYLSSPMGGLSADLVCGSDISCFKVNQWAYITDPVAGGGEWIQISEVTPAGNKLCYSQMALSRVYDVDAVVAVVNRIRFFVDDTADPDHPSLMMQLQGHEPQVYAEDISDLQFRYLMTTGGIEDAPVLADNIREVLIELTGQSHMLLDGIDGDGRTKTYSTSVHLRNLAS